MGWSKWGYLSSVFLLGALREALKRDGFSEVESARGPHDSIGVVARAANGQLTFFAPQNSSGTLIDKAAKHILNGLQAPLAPLARRQDRAIEKLIDTGDIIKLCERVGMDMSGDTYDIAKRYPISGQ